MERYHAKFTSNNDSKSVGCIGSSRGTSSISCNSSNSIPRASTSDMQLLSCLQAPAVLHPQDLFYCSLVMLTIIRTWLEQTRIDLDAGKPADERITTWHKWCCGPWVSLLVILEPQVGESIIISRQSRFHKSSPMTSAWICIYIYSVICNRSIETALYYFSR